MATFSLPGDLGSLLTPLQIFPSIFSNKTHFSYSKHVCAEKNMPMPRCGYVVVVASNLKSHFLHSSIVSALQLAKVHSFLFELNKVPLIVQLWISCLKVHLMN